MIQPASGPGVCERRQMQDLLEILGDEETDFGALLLQNDVGRHRRAVKQGADVGGGTPVSSISCWMPLRIPTD